MLATQIIIQKLDKAYFVQHLELATPKYWLKYIAMGYPENNTFYNTLASILLLEIWQLILGDSLIYNIIIEWTGEGYND